MKNIHILLPLFLILTMTSFLIVFSQAISKEVEHEAEESRYDVIEDDYTFIEDRIDGHWTVEKGMNKGEVLISVNAEKIHADRLYFRLMHDCETINVLASFLSKKENPKTENIKQLYLSTQYLKEYMLVHVPVVNKLTSEESEYDHDAWIFWLDLGWYPADKIKSWHKNIDEITLSIQHDALFKADNYLDNKDNSWSTNGMNEAIDRAIGVCILKELNKNKEVVDN